MNQKFITTLGLFGVGLGLSHSLSFVFYGLDFIDHNSHIRPDLFLRLFEYGLSFIEDIKAAKFPQSFLVPGIDADIIIRAQVGGHGCCEHRGELSVLGLDVGGAPLVLMAIIASHEDDHFLAGVFGVLLELVLPLAVLEGLRHVFLGLGFLVKTRPGVPWAIRAVNIVLTIFFVKQNSNLLLDWD